MLNSILIHFILKLNFREYPNNDEKHGQDVKNFVLLLQELKLKLGTEYLLSVAIGAGEWRSGVSYDIPAIFETVDFVNLMSYDLHGGWESTTGIHTALYAGPQDDTVWNVDAAVKFLLQKRIPREKLILGIATYGNAFKLKDSKNNGVGAPATGDGNLKYHEICSKIKSGSLEDRWEDTQKVPYAFGGSKWVGYDNIRSVEIKAKYIDDKGLGGAMFWALDSDDYSGGWGIGDFPLIRAVHSTCLFNTLPRQPTRPPRKAKDTSWCSLL